MRSQAIVLGLMMALPPGGVLAQDKPKASDAPAVWPPPADEDPPKKPAPKEKVAKGSKEKDKEDASVKETSDAPLPRLMEDEDAPKESAPPPEPPANPCDAPADECRENCTIEHTNDDTTQLNGRKPLVTCIKRCETARSSCEERRHLGLQEKRAEDAPP